MSYEVVEKNTPRFQIEIDYVRVRAVGRNEDRQRPWAGTAGEGAAVLDLLRDELTTNDAAPGNACEERPDENCEVDEHHAEGAGQRRKVRQRQPG